MNDQALWQPLARALERFGPADRLARFWLRDDDAIVPTQALDRLLALTGHHSVPLALAVIPAHTGPELSRRLKSEEHVTVTVHGWSHENHAPEGAKKQELGLHRPRQIVLDELARGAGRLAYLFGPQFAPVLVPPWNRIDAGLIPELPSLGYAALSVFGVPKPAPLPVVNANVDLMDWHGTRGCRDHGALVAEIVAALERCFETGEPVGILTHHLVHDQAAWNFLTRLFAETNRHSAVSWADIGALI